MSLSLKDTLNHRQAASPHPQATGWEVLRTDSAANPSRAGITGLFFFLFFFFPLFFFKRRGAARGAGQGGGGGDAAARRGPAAPWRGRLVSPALPVRSGAEPRSRAAGRAASRHPPPQPRTAMPRDPAA